MIIKLLKNPVVISILQILSKKQHTIPQIVEILQNSDIKTVIAILGELHHFGLVKQVYPLIANEISENQKVKKQNNYYPSEIMSNVNNFPLGIPISDYNILWEKIMKYPEQSSHRELNNLYFSVPGHLKAKFQGSISERNHINELG
ncbi:MAG: hypothetical protein ACXAC8_00625 [Candidatus Hodarchaeales archaeon]|jgi:hypothetical protein